MGAFKNNTDGSPDCVSNWKILEQLLDRMSWKDHRKMILSLPPVCLSSAVKPIEDSLIGIVSPVSGTFTRLIVRVVFSGKPPGIVRLTMEGANNTSSQVFEVTGNILIKELNESIETGTLIQVTSIGPEGVISSLGFSCLISPKDSILRHVPNAFPSMEDANA